MFDHYFRKLIELLSTIEKEEADNIQAAAQKIAHCIQMGGIVHVFGCGHSHLLAEELFYRAGGLAAVNPLLIEDLMLHKGAVRSSQLEKQNDLAFQYLEMVDIQSRDVLIVASTSGRNPFPINVAEWAKQKGAEVISISSLDYTDSVSTRHKNGIFLSDIADIAIDSHIEVGDALMNHERLDYSFGSGSTVMGTAIVNSIMVQAVKMMSDNNFTPPVFKSGNIDGAEDHNNKLISKYKNRIPLLGN